MTLRRNHVRMDGTVRGLAKSDQCFISRGSRILKRQPGSPSSCRVARRSRSSSAFERRMTALPERARATLSLHSSWRSNSVEVAQRMIKSPAPIKILETSNIYTGAGRSGGAARCQHLQSLSGRWAITQTHSPPNKPNWVAHLRGVNWLPVPLHHLGPLP
jgi:hypothetical protein